MNWEKQIEKRLAYFEQHPVERRKIVPIKDIVVIRGKLRDKKVIARNREIARLKGMRRILKIDEDGLMKMAKWRHGLLEETPSAKLLKAHEQWAKSLDRFTPDSCEIIRLG